jgi:hypothetical protein
MLCINSESETHGEKHWKQVKYLSKTKKNMHFWIHVDTRNSWFCKKVQIICSLPWMTCSLYGSTFLQKLQRLYSFVFYWKSRNNPSLILLETWSLVIFYLLCPLNLISSYLTEWKHYFWEVRVFSLIAKCCTILSLHNRFFCTKEYNYGLLISAL